jgi:hypothetical protein
MNNYNYHPVRWFTSTIATLASFSLWFTWTKFNEANIYFIAERTKNGYNDWGFLTIAGIVGVFVAVFIGERTKPLDQNSKLIACASFAVIALGGIISMAASGANVKNGPGPWIAIFLGVIGLVLSTGLIKIPDNFPSSFNQSPTSNITPPGPPPTPGAIPPTPGSMPPPPPSPPVS